MDRSPNEAVEEEAASGRARSSIGSKVAGLFARVPSSLRVAYSMGPIGLAIIVVFSDFHLIHTRPLWQWAVVIVGPTMTTSTVSNILYARYPGYRTLHLRAATDVLSTSLVAYSTGWGPVLGVIYLVAAEQLVLATSPATWRVTRLWTFLGIVGGQAAIALHWAPSYLKSPADNGVAALGFAGFLLVSRMAGVVATERDEALEKAQDSEERFRSLVQSSSDLIVVLNDEWLPAYVSGAAERILGLSPEELLASDLRTLVNPDDFESIRECFTEAIGRPEPTQPFEIRVAHADGRWKNVEMVGTNLRDNPAVGGVVLNARDITDRRRIEAELAHFATHDALTGLPNRMLFLERLTNRLERRKGGAGEPAVLFLDVDRFKLINDTLGHEIGDQLLVEAAHRLKAVVRSGDTVARFGGDEFVILCESSGNPQELAARLLATFEQPFCLNGENYFLSASIGVADSAGLESTGADLIRDADTAMYRAKEQGRGQFQVFDEEARAAAVARVHIEHLLRGAAERDELRLFYQPVVDLASGEVVAAEALIRWQHPQLGLIGPARFIETAEDSGLIVPIGEWVLEEASRQAARWADRGTPISIAVNVSARQLAGESFPEDVARILDRVGAADHGVNLTVEITESLLIQEPEAVAHRLDELKSLGIRLSMDDFGTGYSSLSNLRRYPFDSLKIDRRFVAGLTDSDDDGTIVRAIIALAHGLGKIVVAEGVETADQLRILRQLGCDMAQGFHLGRPQPATALPSELLLPEHRGTLGPAPSPPISALLGVVG